MTIRAKLRGAMRRIAGVSLAGSMEGKRRTAPLPSILNTYVPRPEAYPKPSPANLRRFSETPVARKAINTIKDSIAGMRWRIQPRPGQDAGFPDVESRVRILTENLDSPNPDDSFRSLAEQVLEDVIVGGFGAMEVEATEDAVATPHALAGGRGVASALRAIGTACPDLPRYAQMTGRTGPEAQDRTERW